MQSLHDIARPGLMLSQTWPTSREKEGETLRALETALAQDFFTSFQTVEVPFAGERKQIASALDGKRFIYDYCVARILNENKYNLSDLDADNRLRGCDGMKRQLDDAREAGAQTFTVISGPVPAEAADRGEALKRLTESLRMIAVEAKQSPALKLTIEPLDVDIHKKHTLGYTGEAVEIVGALRNEGLDVALLLDTSHMILNAEDSLESLELAKEHTAAFHYCNCVTDQSHALFGDRHIRFGDPGVLDMRGIAKLMKGQVEIGFFNDTDKPPVMCEVMRQDGEDSAELMTYCREVLDGAWERAATEDR